MGAIPRSDPRREAARRDSMWDMYVATERWDEAENLRPGSTWLAGIVRHSDVVAGLPPSIRADFLPKPKPTRRIIPDREDLQAQLRQAWAEGDWKPTVDLKYRIEEDVEQIAATLSVPPVILVGDPRNPYAAITSEGIEWRPWMESERIR